jgi:rubrerythrin
MAKRKVNGFTMWCSECGNGFDHKNKPSKCNTCNRFELGTFTKIQPSHWEPIEEKTK